MLKYIVMAGYLLLLGAPPASAVPSLIEDLRQVQESLVTIRAEIYRVHSSRIGVFERTSSGVILDQNTIVTNTHTIENAQKIRIILSDGSELTAGQASVVHGRDFSFLRIRPKRNLRPIEWADSDVIQLGAEVINVGHSELLRQTISGGRIIGVGRNTDPAARPSIHVIETDIVLYKGDSGGPLLDREGRLLGLMAASHRKNRRTTSFAIPSNIIRLTYLEYLKK